MLIEANHTHITGDQSVPADTMCIWPMPFAYPTDRDRGVQERWQIELLFKWIKQNLKIKSFLGTSNKPCCRSGSPSAYPCMHAYMSTSRLRTGSAPTCTRSYAR